MCVRLCAPVDASGGGLCGAFWNIPRRRRREVVPGGGRGTQATCVGNGGAVVTRRRPFLTVLDEANREEQLPILFYA